MRAPQAVFVSWYPFHGRSEGLARSLDIPAWFSDGGRGPAAVRDLRRWRWTTRMFREERPDVIIVMQPPVIALWCAWWYARKTHVRIAGDLHTGVFTEVGTRLLKRHTLSLLRRHGVAVVTNDTLRSIVETHGCPAVVLHDLIEVADCDNSPPDSPVLAELAGQSYILVPLSYSHDEPIEELLRAARMAPDLRWVFTGRPPRRVMSRAPTNVSFPGFVSQRDYQRAVSQAEVVVAMTMHETTMQRAGYEALSYGRPLVTADTEVLRDYYGGCAEIVAALGPAIVDGVRHVLADGDAADRMRELRMRKIVEQEQSLSRLRAWVYGPGTTTETRSRSY